MLFLYNVQVTLAWTHHVRGMGFVATTPLVILNQHSPGETEDYLELLDTAICPLRWQGWGMQRPGRWLILSRHSPDKKKEESLETFSQNGR